ncbi:MAG: hypothetical protein WBP61_09255 [Nocardioides sp.]
MASTVELLLRWEASGGTWYAVGADQIALCRCDGGEVVERLPVADEETAAYLRSRPASSDAS